MLTFSIVESNQEIWDSISLCEKKTCYHSKEWADYLSHLGNRVHIFSISEVNQSKTELIGYFIGEDRRLLRGLLFSPMFGSGSYSQGIIFLRKESEKEKISIYLALQEWLYRNHYIYTRVADWGLRHNENQYIPENQYCYPLLDEFGIRYRIRATYYIDLTCSVEELWKKLSYKSCRYCINKAVKEGLRVNVITDGSDIPRFVDQHYLHIRDVSQRHNTQIRPFERKKNLTALCNALFPSNLMLIEVLYKSAGGGDYSISTAIFCLDKNSSSFFSGASYSKFQHLCPNELMIWESIRRIKEYGSNELQMCGLSAYKRKYGAQLAYFPVMSFSKIKLLNKLRPLAKKLYYSIFCDRFKIKK